MSDNYLEQQTARSLLTGRKYQRRDVLGGSQLRAALQLPPGEKGNTAAVPAYLPASLAAKLPMFSSLFVRVIAELHLRQDQYESHAAALRIVALARVVDFGSHG